MGAGLQVDVVVVGAGLAGLTAATRLRAAGREVAVLEARDRVGGRTYDVPTTAGATLELGAQFVGARHHRLRRLVRRLGLMLSPTHDTGRHLLDLGGVRRLYLGPLPPLPPWQLADAGMLHLRLARAARRLAASGPADPPRAAFSDVAGWVRRHARTAVGETFLRLFVESVLGAEPEEVSLAHLLHYLRANGGLAALARTRGGAQQDRIVGGPAQISERLVKEVDEVRLADPVTGVSWDASGVRVHTAGGVAMRAAQAIFALPPAPLARIDFTPDLPQPHRRVIRSMRHGDVIKTEVVYDEPWWRAEGLSGQAVSDASLAPVVFDNTPPAGRPGALMVLTAGRAAARLRREPDRRRAMLDALTGHFGPRAGHACDYHDHDWTADPWTLGCYGGYAPPGVWTGYGAILREPVGPLHWAGTETARSDTGYMEGAIESGERVAEEILGGEDTATRRLVGGGARR